MAKVSVLRKRGKGVNCAMQIEASELVGLAVSDAGPEARRLGFKYVVRKDGCRYFLKERVG